MISGMSFRPWLAPELESAALRARQLCLAYGSVSASEITSMSELIDQRATHLHEIIGGAASRPNIEPPCFFSYGCNISLGLKFYANINLSIFDSAFVTIGDRVLVGPNVSIITDSHDVDVESRINGVQYARPVNIGSDCWIGASVSILPGVTIGEGCTIGAGAVVTRNIAAHSLALGIPAKVVRSLK